MRSLESITRRTATDGDNDRASVNQHDAARARPIDRDDLPVSSLRNIGPTIALRLNEIGVHTAADLARLGPAAAFRRMKAAEGSRRTPRCYYLYSLQGALDDRHWNEIQPARKAALRESVR